MAVVSVQLLILLDPQYSHRHYETQIDLRIFKRCNNSQECRTHLVNQEDIDKHLFLPDFETEIAEGPLPGLSNVHIYVYCHGQQLIDPNDERFRGRILNRIFAVNELPFYLYHAGIEVSFKLLTKPPSGLSESGRDELAVTAKQQLTELRDLFDQYMTTQLGQQALDLP